MAWRLDKARAGAGSSLPKLASAKGEASIFHRLTLEHDRKLLDEGSGSPSPVRLRARADDDDGADDDADGEGAGVAAKAKPRERVRAEVSRNVSSHLPNEEVSIDWLRGALRASKPGAGAGGAPEPKSKVVRFASDTHLSGGGHTRRRPTGFRPDDDGFDNPLGGRLQTAQQRASGRRSRPAPRRAADGTSWVTSTAMAVFLVIILSNVLPRALEMLYDARTEAAFEAEDREEW